MPRMKILRLPHKGMFWYLESHYMIRTFEPLPPKTCYRYMNQPVLSFSFLFSDRPAGIGKMMDSGRKLYLSLVVRKPIFGVSEQARHKPGCTATEDGSRLEISDLGNRGIVLSV